MPWHIHCGQAQPYRHLLRHFHSEHDVISGAAAAAALVEQQAGPFEDLRAVLDQPAHAELATGLFIGTGHEHHVAVQWQAGTVQAQERGQVRDARALHVAGATAQDIAVTDLAGQWLYGPVLHFGRHHVGMLQKDQCRLVAPLQARPDIAPSWCALGRLKRNAFRFEDAGIELHGAVLVAGRVDGVHLDELLKPSNGLVFNGLRLQRGRQQAQQHQQDTRTHEGRSPREQA